MTFVFQTSHTTRGLEKLSLLTYSWECLAFICNNHFQSYWLPECTLQFLFCLTSYCPDP